MKIFISWAGSRSKKIGTAMKDFLPKIIKDVDPWMSARSLTPGTVWQPKLFQNLNESKSAILCLTPEALDSKWIYFEAGAVAKAIGHSPLVCPFLIDLSPIDVKDLPVGAFQAIDANKENTLQLLMAINEKCETPLSEAKLTSAFDKHWPEFDAVLNDVKRTFRDDLPFSIVGQMKVAKKDDTKIGFKLKVWFDVKNRTKGTLILSDATFSYNVANGLKPHHPGVNGPFYDKCSLVFRNEATKTEGPEITLGPGGRTSFWIAFQFDKHTEEQVDAVRLDRNLGIFEVKATSKEGDIKMNL